MLVFTYHLSAHESARSDARLAAGTKREDTDVTRQLLLAHLADRRRGDTVLSNAAVEFILCQAFASDVAQLQKAGASDEEQAGLLVSYRTQLSALQRPAASPLTEGELPRDPAC